MPDPATTSPPSAAPPHPRRRRWLWIVPLVIVVLLAVLAGAAYWRVRAAQPRLDGTLQLSALTAPVEVVRDNRGIPHITARNIHDLYVAQGFVMAQDRLWQMDLMRRLGEGRLAEVFGPRALAVDQKNRALGLGHTADMEAQRLGPQEKLLLDAFDAGVNANIALRRHRLPLPFLLLGYQPQSWKPRDTMALAAYMYQVLASGFGDKLMRESFGYKLGAAKPGSPGRQLYQDLFPTQSPWDVVPGGPLPPAAVHQGRSRGFADAGAGALPVFNPGLPPPADLRGGSNDWVVSGNRSFTGKPLLANDPHLTFQIPGLWWAVQLTAPGVNVEGVAIAGVPGVIIGHNDHIAWGVTNTRADVQDLYREQLDGKGDVLTPTGWKPLQYWNEQILVKGQKPVEMKIPVTPHGPIVAKDSGGALALDWTMYAPGALQSVHVFLALDEARDWQQFRAALAAFPGPTQNFVYADTAGNIGYQAAGWVPLRGHADGSLPVPGNTGAFDWQGWIPFEKLPSVYNPKDGVLATANSRITPDKYPFIISTDWDAPNRTRRIYELLEELPKWNASAMDRVQQDVTSEQDADFARVLAAAAEARRAQGFEPSAAVREALGRLRGFAVGGLMGHASVAPTLAVMARRDFLRRVLVAKVGDSLARHYKWDEAPVFEQWLLAQRPARWLPPEYAPAATKRGGQRQSMGGWDALLLDSLASAVQSYTLSPQQARWGLFETLAVEHPVYSHIPFLRGRADLGPVEINGSPLTIKQARSTALGDASDLGPSMRFIADTANWDHSTLTLVAGESGDLFSPHYRDQFNDYLRAKGLPLWFTPAAIAAHREHELTLAP